MGDVSEYRNSFSRKVGCELVFNPANQEEKEKVIRGADAGRAGARRGRDCERGGVRGRDEAGRSGRDGPALRGAQEGATGTIDLARLFLNGTSVVTSYASSEKETHAATRLLADEGARRSRT